MSPSIGAAAPTVRAVVDRAPSGRKGRDPRIDVLRGLALLMIFVDHVPGNVLGMITMHNFGFCDAAEIFVFLAGVSSMLAYGRGIARDGWMAGVRRVALRCFRLYVFQAIMLIAAVVIAEAWGGAFNVQPSGNPFWQVPGVGVVSAFTLAGQPPFFDILPMYIALLSLFPLLYWGMQRRPWLTLGVSALVWLAANLMPGLNLPNWFDQKQGWYFDPFAWQFLFALGAMLPRMVKDGNLPYYRGLAWACGAYIFFAFLEATPWHAWHLPNLAPFQIGMLDKPHLVWPRILDILALCYLVFASPSVRSLASKRWLRPIDYCGRHSLEVFTVGCLCALVGRLAFATISAGPVVQLLINAFGMGAMLVTAAWLERERQAAVNRPARAGTKLAAMRV